MGSQEGCHRKEWTNFSNSGNPGSSEGKGGDRPGWEAGSQNRIGGADQVKELIHHRRRRRRGSSPIMGDRRA